MIDTEEYYGGTYPEPSEIEETNVIDEDDYDLYMADIMHEEMMLGENN